MTNNANNSANQEFGSSNEIKKYMPQCDPFIGMKEID